MGKDKPSLPNGFIGGQPRFSEMKLKTDSHKSSTFKVSGESTETIKIKTGVPVKVVTKLVQCESDREYPERVFIQRKDGEVQFTLGFPDDGWYKFQIFALQEEESTESLPNVYNYLIEVEDNKRPSQPFVKTYTKFYKDFCYLDTPIAIDPSRDNLEEVKFKVKVPGAVKVAIHAVDEWFHLEKDDGDTWKGEADLARFKAAGAKITMNANYDKDSNSYSVLLEYNI